MKVQVQLGRDVYEVEIDASDTDIADGLPLGYSARPGEQSLVPHFRPARQVSDLAAEVKLCRSPLAGIVARVNIAGGEQVQPGDVMIVLEAMKMETNISAPAALKTKSVKVKPGDVVKPDQILLEFE